MLPWPSFLSVLDLTDSFCYNGGNLESSNVSARRRKMIFQIVLEPSEDGGYTVYVPSLPGCISEGDTVEDALANIQEAVELYLEPDIG
jgi:hypothetical protein